MYQLISEIENVTELANAENATAPSQTPQNVSPVNSAAFLLSDIDIFGEKVG